MTDTEKRAPLPSPTPNRLRRTALKLAFSLGLTLGLLEVGSRIVFWKELKEFEPWMVHPAFYYQDSKNPILGYELKHDYTYAIDGRRIHVNHDGVRDDEETVPAAPRKIVVLGDSVVFGTGQSQDDTLSGLLQQRYDPSKSKIRLFNFGVPGYAAREVLEYLRDKNAAYHATDVVYILNPNDFAWRDTRFEGADSGLYRMFHAPASATLFLTRKAIYRAHKSGKVVLESEVLVSVPWYKWMFHGTHDRVYDTLREMKAYAASNQIRLSIVPLPAGCAFHGDTYDLDAEYDDLFSFLRAEAIPTFDARKTLNVPSYFDPTDHLTDEGNRKMVQILQKVIGEPPAR